ncbi:MAG: GH3 auxin-responsive promoter family protein [Bacteroidota bacterium]
MPFLRSIISWLIIKRMTQIELMRKYPFDVQRETFQKLITTAKDTEFGRLYDFQSIDSYETFRSRIPIQHYEDIQPYVMRLMKGEQNILWPSEIRWFAKSSGTSSDKSKFIPVSRESLEECHFGGGKDMYAIYMTHFPETNIFKGKTLALGGSHQVNNFSNESFYGDLSAVMIKNLPFWADFKRTPGNDIALLPEWDEKIDMMAKATSGENVTSIAGVPSWTLVLLKRILELNGTDSIEGIWPNLELFIHGGVSFKPYRDYFKRIILSSSVSYLETYNASEGFFAIQDDFSCESLLLMLDYGIFYEFIPLDRLQDDPPPAMNIEDVKTGVNYAMIISTNAGLWRYVIGDTVVFDSVSPFRLRITGRIKHFINAFGEELIVDNAEKALEIACSRTGTVIREYTAGPVFMDEQTKGCHEWLFEFINPPPSFEHFLELLDNALKTLNSDYEAKRYKNLTLDFPKATILPDGTFYQWLKSKGKLGGQNKVPRLANHRDYINEILNLARLEK